MGEISVRLIKPQVTLSEAQEYSPDCYASDPVLPVTLAKNHKCRMRHLMGDYNTFATINSHGYRGSEFSIEKKQGVLRILVLGDSFTFGHGVSDDHTYPFELQKILDPKGSKIEIINAGGADGYSPDTYLVYLNNRGFSLKPDVVILSFFVLNDITNLAENVWDKVDNEGFPQKISSCCRVVDGNILRNKNIEYKYRYPILRESHLFILLMDVLVKKLHIVRNKSAFSTKEDSNRGCNLNPDCIPLFYPEEKKVNKILKKINQLANEREIKYFVVLFPADIQLYPDKGGIYGNFIFPKKDNPDFFQKRIAEYFKRSDIKYLDLYPFYDKQRDRGYPYFINDGHMNDVGNKIAAQAVAKYLEDNIISK